MWIWIRIFLPQIRILKTKYCNFDQFLDELDPDPDPYIWIQLDPEPGPQKKYGSATLLKTHAVPPPSKAEYFTSKALPPIRSRFYNARQNNNATQPNLNTPVPTRPQVVLIVITTVTASILSKFTPYKWPKIPQTFNIYLLKL